MKIEHSKVSVREIVDAYSDNGEGGVSGYGGRLNIRPPYQREYVYDLPEERAVIDTVMKGFPLNVMYWAVNDIDGVPPFEVMDGQQRTMSICRYFAGAFSVDDRFYGNLTKDEQQKFLDYELHIYVCEGSESDKLSWFKTINIAGKQLTPQELLNVTYTGPWLSDAKRYFSKTGCPAYKISGRYIKAIANRQEILELAIKWKSETTIKDYMAQHQSDKNANELWLYYKAVFAWVETLFGGNYRSQMKGLPWGEFYNEYGQDDLDKDTLEDEVKKLMSDEDVTSKSGIYRYVFSRDERHLSIRSFSDRDKRTAFEKQSGVCPHCAAEGRDVQVFTMDEMQADHITPWSKGGKTIPENCQMLCKEHNRKKSGH